MSKPTAAAFGQVVALAAIVPSRAAMIEDDVRNFEEPTALGQTTV